MTTSRKLVGDLLNQTRHDPSPLPADLLAGALAVPLAAVAQ
jgi:hypothetical protein